MNWKDKFPKSRYYEEATGILYNANSLDILKEIPDNSIDTVITDPPYGLSNHSEKLIRETLSKWLSGEDDYIPKIKGFMNATWDAFVPPPVLWKEVYRVMKPGGTALVFAGTRTQDLMTISLRLASFEIKDTLMWIYGCISEDTEILTVEGWKSYKTISKKDTVFSFDTKKHKIIKSKINQVFVYPYEGKLINLKNQNTDQLITPNHKVICKMGYRKQKSGKRNWYKEDEWVYRDAWQIKSNQYVLPLASVYDGKWSIGGDFAEVIGWVLSEGNYQKGCNAVNIYQSSVNSENVARIRYCLNRAKIKYSEYKRRRQYKNKKYIEYYQWYISGKDAKKIKEIIPNKKPTFKLLELKYSEKERLIKGLVGCAGSKGRNGKYEAFYQKDIKFLEWFQILLHLTGKQGWINYKKCYCSIHYNDSTQIQSKHNKNRLVQYRGIVWSINTNVGNYIARRNGKIFITGNSGFPKGIDISKQIDKKPKADLVTDFNPVSPDAKLWNGYKSALKPAYEPIILAIKPIEGTYAQNALKWGVAGLNIKNARIGTDTYIIKGGGGGKGTGWGKKNEINEKRIGRFPANILFECTCEHIEIEPTEVKPPKGRAVKHTDPNCPCYMLDEQSSLLKSEYMASNNKRSVSRFFYCAKVSKKERGEGNRHPTIKPIKLLEYLVKLTTMPNKGQIYLDPFAGSGSLAMVCKKLNKNWIAIEISKEYSEIAKNRIKTVETQLNLL